MALSGRLLRTTVVGTLNVPVVVLNVTGTSGMLRGLKGLTLASTNYNFKIEIDGITVFNATFSAIAEHTVSQFSNNRALLNLPFVTSLKITVTPTLITSGYPELILNGDYAIDVKESV